MQALQTLSQREFEMMQCFWEADEPLKMKELQTRWAHGETPQSRSTTLIYVNRLVGNEIFVQNGGAEATGAVSSDCYKRGLLQA